MGSDRAGDRHNERHADFSCYHRRHDTALAVTQQANLRSINSILALEEFVGIRGINCPGIDSRIKLVA
jgi:hypothetical protein